MTKSIITAVGHYEPLKCITNINIAKFCKGSINKEGKLYSGQDIIDKAERAGITERRRAGNDENAATMAVQCIENMQAEYGSHIFDNLDAIITGTFTAPYFHPCVSKHVAQKLGHHGRSFDLNDACVGFLNALEQANFMIRGGLHKVLVIGSDVMSRAIDGSDPKSAVLFGDGAGAFLVEALDCPGYGIQGSVFLSFTEHLSSAYQRSQFCDGSKTGDPFIQLNGPDVYVFGIEYVVQTIKKYLTEKDLTIDDVDRVVPHQANARMLGEIAQKIGLPEKKMIKNVHMNGNTAAASIPLAFSQHKHLFASGDRILMVSLGSGLTVGLVEIISSENGMKNGKY